MGKIVAVLLVAALALLAARLAFEAPALQTLSGAILLDAGAASAPLAPPLMYAGVRG